MLKQQSAAAIYCRLSRDDGGDAESNSIQNQKMLLNKYARENGFRVFSEYVDDGISGTTFEREAFKRMIADIEDGKVGVVICKDLSRLGRNNAMVAYYTEIYFIENRVRFIAVNDQIDTFVGDNEIMPFKSVINEYYARDISKKIRQVKAIQSQQGKHLGGTVPYGYCTDPQDKHRYIINSETSQIVKRMFEMAADGISVYTIAKTLTLEGIPTPMDVRKGQYTGREWQTGNICGMLRNKVYIGHMVTGKKPKPSFKSNKRIYTDPSVWVDVPGMHESIVSTELFDLVQRRIGVKKRRNKSGHDNIFVGLAKCFDCGSSMGLARNSGNRIIYLCCHRYRKHSKDKCSSHYIQYDELYQLVLEGIRENAAIARTNEHRINDYIRQSVAVSVSKSKKSDRASLAKLTGRKDELDQIIKRLFEEYVLGSISKDRFRELSAGYESEINNVTSRIDKLAVTLLEEADHEPNCHHFFDIIKKYTNVEVLDATMLYTLINRIEIHAPQGRRPNRTQEVAIRYRFVDEGLVSPQK